MKVLVVDDSQFARRRLAMVIEKAGHRVIMAENGRKGLALFSEESPDLVTVDLLMPEMDGLEMIREIRKKDMDVPIIVVSADIQEATKREAMAAGANAFLGKVEDLQGILDLMGTIRPKAIVTFFTEQRLDALKETLNISMGRAARAIESIVQREIKLKVPEIEVINRVQVLRDFFRSNMPTIGTSVEQRFMGQLKGIAYLVFPKSQAQAFITLLMEKDKDLEALSEAEKSIITEVGNVVINSSISGLGNLIKERLHISLPMTRFNQEHEVFLQALLDEIGPSFCLVVVLSRLDIGGTAIICYLILSIDATGLAVLIKTLEALS